MESKQAMVKTVTVYVDKLTAASVRSMLAAGILRVIILEELDNQQRKYVATLKKKGVEIEEAIFFAGHLSNPDGESVFLASQRLASEIAFEASHLIVEAQPLLKQINAKYQRETLRLSLAKNLILSIEAYVIRIQVAQALCHPARTLIWLAEPALFNSRLLAKHFPEVQLHFYPASQSRTFLLAKEISWDCARHIKRLYWGWGPPILKPKNPGPSLLMVQEDTIRLDLSLRGQPHWLGADDNLPSFRAYIGNLIPFLSVAENETALAKAALTLVHAPSVRAAWQTRRMHPPLRRLMQDRRTVLRAALLQHGFAETAALLHASRLLLEAERIGALTAWLNVSVFLVRETHSLTADAMQLVANELSVKTIAYQYSNMGTRNPLMMTTADYLIIFSTMYKSLFQYNGITPKAWIIGGYIYDGVADIVRNRAQAYRKMLRDQGAEFIVCYFDESVQHDRWGLVSKDDHLAELHVLAKAVLEDPSFGVVIKSQFMKNSPSQLYSSDDLIQGAKATGRYLELLEGKHRNDVYPTEASLVADLCISQKFGATAALEAAMAGVRTLLINKYGAKTLWDHLYSKVEIEVDSIECVMKKISEFRSLKDNKNQLGDWSQILHEFDPFRDGKAAIRLHHCVETALYKDPCCDKHEIHF